MALEMSWAGFYKVSVCFQKSYSRTQSSKNGSDSLPVSLLDKLKTDLESVKQF